MNSERGIKPEDELRMLKLAGYDSHPGFRQYPSGKFKEDAIAGGVRIEVRWKECTLDRCREGYDDAPPGVSINVGEIEYHKPYGSFLFLIECEDPEKTFPWQKKTRIGYVASVDPLAQYPRGRGRDEDHTGRQDVYGIPVELFHEIYRFKA